MKMTKRIYTVEEIYLQGWNDDTGEQKAVRIYPLVIKKFRQLAEILEDASKPPKKGEKEKTFLDVLLQAVAFAMETFEPGLSDPDVLADYVDMDTLHYILDIAAGIKLDDPNLQAAMATSGKN